MSHGHCNCEHESCKVCSPAKQMTDEITHASSCICVKCETVKEAKRLADAIQSVEYAMKNTGVICTGQPIEGVPCAHSFEHHLRTLITHAQQKPDRDFDKLHDFASNNVTELEMQIMELKQQKPVEVTKLRNILLSIQQQTAAPNILQLTQDGLKIIREVENAV